MSPVGARFYPEQESDGRECHHFPIGSGFIYLKSL